MNDMMNKIKAGFVKISEKIKENKDTVIKISGVILGAALGALTTSVIIKANEDIYYEGDDNLIIGEEADEFFD